MKILFNTNQLDVRGTTDQVYKYAHYCEKILGHKSYICYPKGAEETSLGTFKGKFGVYSYTSVNDLENYVNKEKFDVVYYIRYGVKDFLLNTEARQVIHAVFDVHEPFSDRYAYISSWLSGKNNNLPFVPHIVELPEPEGDYREFLGIPREARVFVRHGGADTFDIPYVQQTVYKIALSNPNIYFLFLNTNPFCPSLNNIIHLAPTTDKSVISNFLHTGDAFLYARERGESFGLAICEALAANLPVICPLECRDRHHIQLMGSNGFYYTSADELATILALFEPTPYPYYKLVEQFSAEAVMRKFEEVFLK